MADGVEKILTGHGAAFLSAPPPNTEVAYCLPEKRARRLGRVGVHRMRLNSVRVFSYGDGREDPAPALYSYACPTCGLTADIGLRTEDAVEFGYRLGVTAIYYEMQMAFLGVPRFGPSPQFLNWLLNRRVPPGGETFVKYFFSDTRRTERFLRVMMHDREVQGHYDEEGRPLTREEFVRAAGLSGLPVVTQTRYEHGGFFVTVNYPPEEPRRRAAKTVRGCDSKGYFYVFHGLKVRDEELRAVRLLGNFEAAFRHRDPKVVRDAEVIFGLMPELRSPVAEFAAQTEKTIMSSLHRLGVGPTAGVSAAYELRDALMTALVKFLADSAIPAASDWEARRRELLMMTPLGRDALAKLDAQRRARAGAGETVLSERQERRLSRRDSHPFKDAECKARPEPTFRELIDYGQFIVADESDVRPGAERPPEGGDFIWASSPHPDRDMFEGFRFVQSADDSPAVTEELASNFHTHPTTVKTPYGNMEAGLNCLVPDCHPDVPVKTAGKPAPRTRLTRTIIARR